MSHRNNIIEFPSSRAIFAPFPKQMGQFPQVAFQVVGDWWLSDGIADGDTVFVRTDLSVELGQIAAVETSSGVVLRRVTDSPSMKHGETVVGPVIGVYRPMQMQRDERSRVC
jgi:hypothetical protein